MNVICFGDSNTYGYDPRSYFGGRYDAGSRWVDILAAETGWTICNMGQNGREIPSSAPSFSADTDLMIVMLGTNDLLQGRSPEQAAEKLESFLSGIPMDRKKILLIAPPPVAWGHGCLISSSLMTPMPSPDSVMPWRSEWASALPMPERGIFPWPMTAYTSQSKGTRPLPQDFWRYSNETDSAPIPSPSAVNRMRRNCIKCLIRERLPADLPGRGQRDDGHPGCHHLGCAGAGRI